MWNHVTVNTCLCISMEQQIPVNTLQIPAARRKVFMVMKNQVAVLWAVTPCNYDVAYQCFGGPCCLYLQGEVTRLWYLRVVCYAWKVIICINMMHIIKKAKQSKVLSRISPNFAVISLVSYPEDTRFESRLIIWLFCVVNGIFQSPRANAGSVAYTRAREFPPTFFFPFVISRSSYPSIMYNVYSWMSVLKLPKTQLIKSCSSNSKH
jgi:hypothetical protein